MRNNIGHRRGRRLASLFAIAALSVGAVGAVSLAPLAGTASATTTIIPIANTAVMAELTCPTADTCVAVGYVEASSGNTTTGVVDVITDGVAAPAQVVASTVELLGVACTSSTSCLAVGYDLDSSGHQVGVVVPIIDSEAGAAQQVPGTGQLTRVACSDTTSCVTVGSDQQGLAGVIVSLTATGSPTGVQTVSGAQLLFGVACRSAQMCIAVGTTNSYAQGAVVDITEGTVGTVQSVPPVAGSNVAELLGVACSSPSDCLASGVEGNLGDSSSLAGIIDPITNGTPAPTVQEVPGTTVLYDVACPDDSCVAAGYLATNNTGNAANAVVVPIDVNGNAGAAPTVQQQAEFEGLTCPSATACDAAGAEITDSAGDATGEVVAFDPTTLPTVTTVTVTPSGSQLYGSTSPSFSYSATPPAGVTISGTLTCTTVSNPAVTISPTLAAGHYSLNGSSCSGLTASGPDDQIAYADGTFNVTSATSTTKVTSSLPTSQFGQAVTFTATVTPSPAGAGPVTGTVTFFDGTTSLGSKALTNGSAQLSTSSLAVGNHSITATYAGNANVSGSPSLPLTQMVVKATTKVAAAAATGLLRKTYSATLTVVFDNAPLAGQSLVFAISGTTFCTATTNSSGVASCTVTSVSIGASYTASYAGNADYLPSQGSAKA